VRPHNWTFGVAAQHELVPRLSVLASYNRRWFNNFFVFKNTLLNAGDFSSQTITAPLNANLPGGGGFPMTYQVLNPGVPTNIQDLYERQQLRRRIGLLARRRRDDQCADAQRLRVSGRHEHRPRRDGLLRARAQMLEIYNPALTNAANNLASTAYQPASACHQAENWLTQFRGLASYQIPRIDVLFSATLQSAPNASTGPTDTTVGSNGTSLTANYSPTPTTTYNLVQPGTFYGPRVNLINLRAAKVLNFGRYKATAGVDLFNLLNSNTGLAFNQNYGTGSNYLQPTSIQTPRFVRLNVTVDF
jgi:hypothetical protein